MAEDCGCKKNKAEGLLSNSTTRRGMGCFDPLDQRRMALIRDEREREKRRRPGTVPARRRCHGRSKKAHRRTWIKVYGPLFDEPRAPGERGGEGDLA